MNIVFLHSHFERGGVTQVVENQVQAIAGRADARLFIASAGRNSGLTQRTLDQTTEIVVPELEYDSMLGPGAGLKATRERATRIVGSLLSAFSEHGIRSNETVLHWHNHSLGKNVAVPGTIKRLSQENGFRQLLQIHDFAEDFRPENFQRLIARFGEEQVPDQDTFNEYCYPVTAGVCYATLTQADRAVLGRLGIPDTNSHVLPNAVSLGKGDEIDQEAALRKVRSEAGLPLDAKWCIYPVRGIRRKNVGEFLLLSRLCSEGMYAGITLPPTTEIERQSYERWRNIADQYAPRAVFDAGTFDSVSFLENLAASSYVISTSVAEGFGMAYLEPWMASRRVIARRLPNVVDDFTAVGVKLNQFYDQILIPGSSDWVSSCSRESRERFELAWASLPTALRPKQRAGVEATDDMIDFAVLTPARQIQVLKHMTEDSGFELAVQQANSDLVSWLASPNDAETIQQNKMLVASEFSLAQTGSQLSELYAKILAEKAEPTLSVKSRSTESALEIICVERPFYPSRTETGITI